MPTYVYECSSCNSTFEAEQRIVEDPLDSCHCGSQGTVKRLIQPIAVMFKGSGFHINDYSGKAAETKTEAAPTTAEHATPAPTPAATSTTEST